MAGLWIPESFISDMVMDEETFETTGTVFAENGRGKLEQRKVTLGMYDDMTGCYEVLSGITAEDYLADPAHPGCAVGASVSRRTPEDFVVVVPETMEWTENEIMDWAEDEDIIEMLPEFQEAIQDEDVIAEAEDLILDMDVAG